MCSTESHLNRCEQYASGQLGIHDQTMENLGARDRRRHHRLARLSVHRGKAPRCCRAPRRSRWQTREEVSGALKGIGLGKNTIRHGCELGESS
jgi:hypothetical protein